MSRPDSIERRIARCVLSVKTFFLVSFLAISSLASVSAQADIRVLAAGGGLLGAPYAAEEIIANGDVIGTIDRPSWSDFRNLTTADIIANYDVFIIPWNTDPAQYDFNWDTRLAPMLASGMGVIWEAPMTTGTAGSPLFTMLGNRYTCNGGAICWIPDTPLNILPSPLDNGITGDFGSSTGYFTSWDSALTPFIDVVATDLGTVVMGLYGQVGAGRIIITHNEQDTIGSSTGTAAQVNAYNLMINKLEWVAASTVSPDPNLRIVPETNGLTEADAITAFNSAGFVVQNLFYTLTNIDASGYVVSQDPQAGAVGFAGDPVTLIVVDAQTGSPVTVPDVTGMTTANAESTLLGVGLERGQLTWGNSPTVPAGSIIAQNPYAGSTDITTGWIVDLVESNGNVPGEVPYVKFLTQTEAGNAITASGYVVGDIATASHNVIAAGSVIDQVPWPGATLAGGEAVDLVVSTGPAGAANISTPDVVGLAQATAESNITGAGLIVGTVSTLSSGTVPAGDVISQSPVAGTLLAAGAAVNLTVSTGPATISVPDVVELPQATAESTLTSAGLTVGVITAEFSDTVAAGAVISQDPVAGTTVGIGSIVNLVISDGPEPALAIVPDVRNVPQADAEASIVGNFLSVGNVTQEYSPAFPVIDAGNVISSNPSGGALVFQGTPVDLVVSLGPAPILTPDVLGLPQADAEAAIIAAGLVVGVVTPFPSDTVPAGNVISQTPLVGYPVAEGTPVDLTISSGPEVIEIIVPNVVGLSQASAESTIIGASLTVGVVLTANSDTVPAGDVISQNPVAGSNVADGSTVDLVVSLGPVAPPAGGDYSYYVLNPLVDNGSISVVSLSDNNTITAGGTTLNLDQGQSGTIPSGDLSQGTQISGAGPFDIGGTVGSTDMPVPSGFAGTEFVLPHYRSTHLYYLMSPSGNATATVNIGGSITTLNLTQGNVVEFNAGTSTTVSGIVTSDNPILMSHTTAEGYDASPVVPATTEVWGIRSNNITVGAMQDNTNITLYASNGSSTSVTLDQGERSVIAVGTSGSEGAGNAIHIVADAPIGVFQNADSDGWEQTSYWPADFHATEYALPVDTQYVAIACPGDNTTITLNDGGSISTQTCASSGNTPGKAYFGSTTDGTNINAGATISSDQPVYLYYEEASNSDERNLLGNVSFGPVPVADIPVPNVVGLIQASAESSIAAAGLTLGSSTTANSATVPAGDVISQSPSAGTLVFAGETVDIVVSLGPVFVSTPDVVGLSQTAAENSITASGLSVGNVITANSTTVAAGDVISQNPSAGTQLNEGSAVDLVVSLGPVTVNTPDVVGLSQTNAESAITSAGLTVTVSTASSTTVAAGDVIGQNPGAGTVVTEGSNVNIVVSTGPADVTVPNVVGSSQAAATNTIIAASLVVGNVTTQNSTTVAAGDVISQNPNGGTTLTEGSAVDLVVSLGPVIINTPNVVGLSQAAAESSIIASGLSVGTVTSTNITHVHAGDVISKNPTAGTGVAEGSNVDLIISLGPVPVIAPVADAGNNQIVDEGDNVNLDGTGSSDADGTIVGYAWTQTAGPSVNLNGSNTSTPDFAAPEVNASIVMSFTLVVTDNVGATDSASVNVTVNNVLIAPTANAGGNQAVTEGDTVNLNGSASSDSNGSIVGYSWTQTAGETVVLSGANSATPNFTAPAAPDTLSFTLTVTDNDGQTASASVTVTVNAVPPPPPPASYEYFVLNPFEPNGNMEVVSLSDGNTITAGGTILNLDNGQSGTIPASDIDQGTRIAGTGPFDIGSTVDSSDMPVPGAFASTQFVIPHYRNSHLYYLMSPNANTSVSIDIGGSVSDINLTQGDVVEFDAGGDNTISGLISSDQPILVAHRSVTTTNRDAFAVPPPALEVWGIYSNNAIMGALEDNTTITVYASNGSSGSYSLDAGGRIAALVGSTGSEGAGNALHIVANKPIMVHQGADSDGLESVAFWEAAFHATEYAIPVDTQYVAIACPGDNTTITLNDSGSISTQTCASSGNTPGKAFFGSTTDGTNINAGATISSDQPVYLYYEEASNSDEHNLLGNVSFGPVPVADIPVPNVVGLVQVSAESSIAAAGLTLGSSTTASSATVPAGDVISQSPSAGTLVFAGDTVNIVVSTGPAIVTVPNVVGSSQTAATNAITASGLTVGTVTTTNSTTVAAGDVISQNPNGGTSLIEGSSVELVVSLGPVIVTAPDVVGLSQAAAESAITSAGLSVGAISTANSDTVAVGDIISQNPTANSNVAEGSAVDLVISLGPTPNVAPTANAGTNQIVTEGDAVNLDGGNSSDSDGFIASYSWTQTGGPAVTLSGASSATPSFTAPQVNADTVLIFSLTVTDNDGQTDTDAVNVTVEDVPPPPPPPAEPIEVFYDSFQNGQWNGLWNEDAQNDWFTSTQRSTSGGISAEVDGSASDAQLISIPIDLQGGTQATITFNWYIESGLDTGEYLAFDVSTDGGSSWTEYERLRGNVDAENTWHSEQVNLNGISSLRLRFRARMSWGGEDANVDEVRVTVQ